MLVQNAAIHQYISLTDDNLYYHNLKKPKVTLTIPILYYKEIEFKLPILNINSINFTSLPQDHM